MSAVFHRTMQTPIRPEYLVTSNENKVFFSSSMPVYGKEFSLGFKCVFHDLHESSTADSFRDHLL